MDKCCINCNYFLLGNFCSDISAKCLSDHILYNDNGDYFDVREYFCEDHKFRKNALEEVSPDHPEKYDLYQGEYINIYYPKKNIENRYENGYIVLTPTGLEEIIESSKGKKEGNKYRHDDPWINSEGKLCKFQEDLLDLMDKFVGNGIELNTSNYDGGRMSIVLTDNIIYAPEYLINKNHYFYYPESLYVIEELDDGDYCFNWLDHFIEKGIKSLNLFINDPMDIKNTVGEIIDDTLEELIKNKEYRENFSESAFEEFQEYFEWYKDLSQE